jgi:hypothetical protein
MLSKDIILSFNLTHLSNEENYTLKIRYQFYKIKMGGRGKGNKCCDPMAFFFFYS